MAEEDQGVEKPKCRSCDDEHVDRDDVGHVVLQKGAPGRGYGIPGFDSGHGHFLRPSSRARGKILHFWEVSSL
jgi:hypothetical protein